MNRPPFARRAALPLAVLAASALLLAACGSDDQPAASPGTTAGSGTTLAATGTTVASATNAAVQKFDKTVQQQLKDVGCYSGTVDGILGPQTDAAIIAFQQASGITVDGEIGPQTEAALAKATAAKKTVCGAATPGTTAAPTPPSTIPPTPTDPPCSATAIAKALPSGTVITSFVCSGIYAGVQGQNSYYSIVKWASVDNGPYNWTIVTGGACSPGQAGDIPPAVITEGCKPA